MARSLTASLHHTLGLLATTVGLVTASLAPAMACSRVLYTGTANTVITGRSLDWMNDTSPNIWAMPRGMKRDGATGPNTITWSSKYGSVVVSMYDIATLDGINEKGLVANVLYLSESKYGAANGKPTLSIAAWGQYVLDRYASVKEAVEALRQEPFRVVAPALPDGHPATAHLALSDPTGDSAIFEYVNGKLVIHHGKQYNVMTNSPTFDQQLALNSYWQEIGGTVFAPGTSRAADRFARASTMVNAIPKSTDPDIITAVPNRSFGFQAMASVLSVMRSISVPLGTKDPKLPNIASTFWRTTYDQKDRILLFDSATSPNTFWIQLSGLNLNPGQPVRKLTVKGGRIYSGDVSSLLSPSEPFPFLSGQAAKSTP